MFSSAIWFDSVATSVLRGYASTTSAGLSLLFANFVWFSNLFQIAKLMENKNFESVHCGSAM